MHIGMFAFRPCFGHAFFLVYASRVVHHALMCITCPTFWPKYKMDYHPIYVSDNDDIT
jgi:hypothetical protein